MYDTIPNYLLLLVDRGAERKKTMEFLLLLLLLCVFPFLDIPHVKR
jgi:hypothetical protein